MKERIGFIGLGLMGEGMAANLLRKGWPLTVLAHRKREPIERLVALGAVEARNARALAEASDIVVLCVTGSPQVEEVTMGAEGLASAGKSLMILDCSTSNPTSTVQLAAELAKRDIVLIDTPLARTPKEAAAGTLDVMAGGDAAAFERARPVLEAFAGRVIHTGPTGSGHTMKLLNNFISLGYSAIYAEALMMGAKAGLTPEVMDSVLARRTHGLRAISGVLRIRAAARRKRAALFHEQCVEGPLLSRKSFAAGERRGEPGQRGGAQFLRRGGRDRQRREIRAGVVGRGRGAERRLAPQA